jgi:pyrroloquinoline quinone biosynthesis protein D
MLKESDKKLTLVSRPAISSTHRFQWEEVQNCHVILYPEGMVKLGGSAAEILKRCDGNNTLRDIIDDLIRHYPGSDLEKDVFKFLETAHENGWVQYK